MCRVLLTDIRSSVRQVLTLFVRSIVSLVVNDIGILRILADRETDDGKTRMKYMYVLTVRKDPSSPDRLRRRRL